MALDDAQWEFYQCTVGESPASIRVDVGVHERAPLRELKHSMRLRVVLPAPRPDGMTSAAEAPALWDLEKKLRGGLPEARLVGIVTNAGHRDFYFYSSEPNEAGAAAEQAVRATIPEYTHECGGFEDAAWEQYFGFLYPNALAWQWIHDRKTLEALEEQGDDGQVARPIQHWAYFAAAEARDRFERELPGLGYRIDERLELEPESRSFGVVFSTVDAERPVDIFRRTERLAILASQFDGHYDGWETPVTPG